jgi:hypothetical protein
MFHTQSGITHDDAVKFVGDSFCFAFNMIRKERIGAYEVDFWLPEINSIILIETCDDPPEQKIKLIKHGFNNPAIIVINTNDFSSLSTCVNTVLLRRQS